MKYTDKQYAQLLVDALEGKGKDEAAGIITGFAALLAEQGVLSYTERIIAAFGRQWNARHGIVEATVTGAQELPESLLHEFVALVKAETGAKTVVTTTVIDRDVIGGAVVRYGDKVIDVSVRGQLMKLREALQRS